MASRSQSPSRVQLWWWGLPQPDQLSERTQRQTIRGGRTQGTSDHRLCLLRRCYSGQASWLSPDLNHHSQKDPDWSRDSCLITVRPPQTTKVIYKQEGPQSGRSESISKHSRRGDLWASFLGVPPCQKFFLGSNLNPFCWKDAFSCCLQPNTWGCGKAQRQDSVLAHTLPN